MKKLRMLLNNMKSSKTSLAVILLPNKKPKIPLKKLRMTMSWKPLLEPGSAMKILWKKQQSRIYSKQLNMKLRYSLSTLGEEQRTRCASFPCPPASALSHENNEETDNPFEWEQPLWVIEGQKLRPTGKSEIMKRQGNLAREITQTLTIPSSNEGI
jgi:hypothetical protein